MAKNKKDKKEEKMPDKLPLLTGKYLPIGGWVEQVIRVDKNDPRWDEAVKLWKSLREE